MSQLLLKPGHLVGDDHRHARERELKGDGAGGREREAGAPERCVFSPFPLDALGPDGPPLGPLTYLVGEMSHGR